MFAIIIELCSLIKLLFLCLPSSTFQWGYDDSHQHCVWGCIPAPLRISFVYIFWTLFGFNRGKLETHERRTSNHKGSLVRNWLEDLPLASRPRNLEKVKWTSRLFSLGECDLSVTLMYSAVCISFILPYQTASASSFYLIPLLFNALLYSLNVRHSSNRVFHCFLSVPAFTEWAVLLTEAVKVA